MNKQTTDTTTVTLDQIRSLEHEATTAGDQATASTCRLALYGATEKIRDAATAEVVEVIRAAEAMDD